MPRNRFYTIHAYFGGFTRDRFVPSNQAKGL